MWGAVYFTVLHCSAVQDTVLKRFSVYHMCVVCSVPWVRGGFGRLSRVWYSAVQNSAKQYKIVQYSTVRCGCDVTSDYAG